MTMNCELCGAEVKVVRETTQHYEPAEPLIKVSQLNEILDRIDITLDCVNNIRQAVKQITEG